MPAKYDPDARMLLVKPTCNLVTIEDGRGGIFTWVTEPIAEFNLIYTRQGENRGHHFHPEFVEYVLVVSGEGVYTRWCNKQVQGLRVGGGQSKYPFIKMGPGMCIRFDIGCPHTLTAITDMRMIALLTKKWVDCEEPMISIKT